MKSISAQPESAVARESCASVPRTWVRIDLAALRRNAARVMACLPAGTRLIVSAKKEGYGHGMLAVARALAGAPGFGMIGIATIEEALALREAMPQVPILCFSVLTGRELEAAVAADVALTVTNLAEARQADAAALKTGRRARLHFKIDTGMGRLGRFAEEIAGQMPAVAALRHASLDALLTHLSDAWENRDSGRRQWTALRLFRRDAGLEHLPCHLGGSDALALAGHGGPFDLRAGIALYGDHPGVQGLEPVMTFKSRVVFVREVPAGATLSYGMTFRTERPSRLAIVGVGYGNGYLRALSNRAEVLIGGRRCPVRGRVCMDQIVVDVTDIPPVALDQETVLFGRQGDAVLPVGEIAAHAATTSRELTSLAGQINFRQVIDDEDVASAPQARGGRSGSAAGR